MKTLAFWLAGVAIALSPLLLGCGGGTGSWSPNDTRKATEIVVEGQAGLTLCSDGDGVACTASQVRALDEVIVCKASSLLYVHRRPVPRDAGQDCR